MDHQPDHEGTGAISLNAVRRENLAFIWVWVVYYAWVVAFTTWWTTPAGTGTAFDGEFRRVIQIVNMISSAACVFTFKKERFALTALLGAVALVPALVLFFIAPSHQIKMAAAVLLGAPLGCVNISILIPSVALFRWPPAC